MHVWVMLNWGIGKEILATLLSYPWMTIERVITDDDPDTKDPWRNAVFNLARDMGLTIDHRNNWEYVELSRHLSKMDLLITHGWPDILPSSVFQAPKLGAINLHPSLLPCYRGPAPHLQVLKNRDPVTGITCHMIDAGIDTGPIISQRQVRLSGKETLNELIDCLKPLVPPLLDDAFQCLLNPIFKPYPQDESIATYARKNP